MWRRVIIDQVDYHQSPFLSAGQQQCAQVGFKVVREVLSVLRVTELGKSLGAHVIFYKSKNAKPFKVTILSLKLNITLPYDYTMILSSAEESHNLCPVQSHVKNMECG